MTEGGPWAWLQKAAKEQESLPPPSVPPLPGPSPAAKRTGGRAAAGGGGGAGASQLLDLAEASARSAAAVQVAVEEHLKKEKERRSEEDRNRERRRGSREREASSGAHALAASPGVLVKIARIVVVVCGRSGGDGRRHVGMMARTCRVWRAALSDSMGLVEYFSIFALANEDAGPGQRRTGRPSNDADSEAAALSLLEQLNRQEEQRQLQAVAHQPQAQQQQPAQPQNSQGGMAAPLSRFKQGFFSATQGSSKRVEELEKENASLHSERDSLQAQVQADELIKRFQDERIKELETLTGGGAGGECEACPDLKARLAAAEKEAADARAASREQAEQFQRAKAVLVAEVKRLRGQE